MNIDDAHTQQNAFVKFYILVHWLQGSFLNGVVLANLIKFYYPRRKTCVALGNS